MSHGTDPQGLGSPLKGRDTIPLNDFFSFGVLVTPRVLVVGHGHL